MLDSQQLTPLLSCNTGQDGQVLAQHPPSPRSLE